jgi:hypothetical protein
MTRTKSAPSTPVTALLWCWRVEASIDVTPQPGPVKPSQHTVHNQRGERGIRSHENKEGTEVSGRDVMWCMHWFMHWCGTFHRPLLCRLPDPIVCLPPLLCLAPKTNQNDDLFLLMSYNIVIIRSIIILILILSYLLPHNVTYPCRRSILPVVGPCRRHSGRDRYTGACSPPDTPTDNLHMKNT